MKLQNSQLKLQTDKVNTHIYNKVWGGVLAIVLLSACHTTKTVVQTPVPVLAPQVADTTALPPFPAEALYIIGREWEAIYDSTTAKYFTPRAEQVRMEDMSMNDYIEQRLLELYPERAYPGYVEKVEQMAQMLIYAHAQTTSIANFMDSELPSPAQLNARYSADRSVAFSADSMAHEIAFLELTGDELLRFNHLNRLAEQSRWIGRATLDSLTLSSVEEENLGITIMLWRGPRMFYRVFQSKERAAHLAEYYYPGATAGGHIGDAYRHTLVNVLLRTYVGLPMTYMIMDLFWETAHPNAPCDTYMDLHNNVVGRRSHYADFVYSEPSDLPSWQQWAEHVHTYIADSTNAAFCDWNRETPSMVVIPQANAVDSKKYIIWVK